jgi:broad specificity phosphatase PhoE
MVRHGESIANVAARDAWERGAEEVDVGMRDPDVPLSPTGREQAVAVGRWLASLPEDERPTAVLSSPYVRAADTARLALERLPGHPPLVLDERLRDREFGELSLLTPRGIEARFPQEAARKRRLGKFSYRPPGGESWADVALRLRSLFADVERENAGGRVLVFAHDAIILLTRYIVERLSEKEILDVERTPVKNGSVTVWVRTEGELRLAAFNATDLPRYGGLPA